MSTKYDKYDIVLYVPFSENGQTITAREAIEKIIGWAREDWEYMPIAGRRAIERTEKAMAEQESVDNSELDKAWKAAYVRSLKSQHSGILVLSPQAELEASRKYLRAHRAVRIAAYAAFGAFRPEEAAAMLHHASLEFQGKPYCDISQEVAA